MVELKDSQQWEMRWWGQAAASLPLDADGRAEADGRADGCSLMGEWGQAAVLLMPDADGTGSASFLNSILSTFFKNRASNIWVVAFFFFSFFLLLLFFF